MLDQVQPEAGQLALLSDAGIGQPDRRHQVATAELGQHPGVDPVGLAGERGQPFHLQRVGDLDLPASQLELIMDKAGTVHRLDRRPHRLVVPGKPLRQRAQPIRVRRRRTNLDPLARLVEQTKIETFATQIQTSVQH